MRPDLPSPSSREVSPAIFPHIEVLDGFRSVGEYLVIAAVYGNRYIRHKVYMNRLSMKSKQFVNGYQRI